MDGVFSHQIRSNLEVYVDDVIVKTIGGRNHTKDLEDIMQLVRKYNMRLNHSKFSFEVQAIKFHVKLLVLRLVVVLEVWGKARFVGNLNQVI